MCSLLPGSALVVVHRGDQHNSEEAKLFPLQQLPRQTIADYDHFGTSNRDSEVLQISLDNGVDISPESSPPPTPCSEAMPTLMPIIQNNTMFNFPPSNGHGIQTHSLQHYPHSLQMKQYPDMSTEPTQSHCTAVEGTGTNLCTINRQYDFSTRVPNNQPWPGEYNFHLYFDYEVRKDRPSKSPVCTYSHKLKRLFLKQNQKIPISFTVSHELPLDCYLRATTIFKTPAKIRDNLYVCPKHKADVVEQSLQHPEHFTRSANDGAIYENDRNGKSSVLIPLKSLQANQDNIFTALFVFPCFSSCLPKDSCHLAEIIFTLECPNNILGRACIDIRVCASPGRDRIVAEETSLGKKRKANDGEHAQPVLSKRAVTTAMSVEDDRNQQQTYVVTTNNKDLYDLLIMLKNHAEPFYSSSSISSFPQGTS